jgi:hypothetical protein
VEALFARAPAPCRGEEHPKVKQRQAHSAQLRQGLVGPVHFIMYIVEDNKKNTSQNWKTTASICSKKIWKTTTVFTQCRKGYSSSTVSSQTIFNLTI